MGKYPNGHLLMILRRLRFAKASLRSLRKVRVHRLTSLNPPERTLPLLLRLPHMVGREKGKVMKKIWVPPN
jgi:hypothetical protein